MNFNKAAKYYEKCDKNNNSSGNGRNVTSPSSPSSSTSATVAGNVVDKIVSSNKTNKCSKSATLATSTRFVPFRRRTSDTTTTSESESDADFGKSILLCGGGGGVGGGGTTVSSSIATSPTSVSSTGVVSSNPLALHRHSLHQIPLMTSSAISTSSSAITKPIEELSSSYSRSSSESCNSSAGQPKNSNYQCMLKDLSELSQLGAELENDLMSVTQSENLDDFRSRLNLRRKLKSRDCFYLDDDRSNASLDSTTTQAHREILRSADLLRQDPDIYSISYTPGPSSSSVYSGKQMINYSTQQPQQHQQHQQQQQQQQLQQKQKPDVGNSSKRGQMSIVRSKTESNFRPEDVDPQQKVLHGKASPSPRFSRKKTQVLKAATSIPSLLFSNKNSSKSSKTMSYYQDSSGKNSTGESSKKNSIDDDSIFATKARRSPLRFLGNLVDDKIFRGRWSSQKRAKSTDEITWALANEEMLKNQDNLRKKSLGFFASPTREEDRYVKSQTISLRTNTSNNFNNNNNNEYLKIVTSGNVSGNRQQQAAVRNDNDLGIDPATLAEIEKRSTQETLQVSFIDLLPITKMENITRSGKKMFRNLNKKLHPIGSEFHFSITPTKPRKSKLAFDDCEEDETTETFDESIQTTDSSPTKTGKPESDALNVGFSYLPTQIRRKILSKPLSFTLMVAGTSGLGKSTFVNSLFLTDIYSDQYPGPSERPTKTVSVESTSVVLTENSVSLNVTIVDTPGFARNLDNSSCWHPLITYLKSQHCEYLRGEINFDADINDQRVHCCLYFLEPTGHGLEKIDIESMKQLCKHVNLIPVIAKADSMTPEEIKAFKLRIRQDLASNKINVFNFHDADADDNDIKFEFPFAVAGSNYIKQLPSGQRIRVRKYPWGTFEIDNSSHCDTSLLRDLLIKHCMYDLIESTHSIHYESYRRDCLNKGLVTNPVFKHNESEDSNISIKDSTLYRALDTTDD